MQLTEIKFLHAKGQPDEWSIEGKPVNGVFGQWLSFGQMTLIVGKNATGKSKTVELIRNIADMFSGDDNLSHLRVFGKGTGEYQLRFKDGTQRYEYYLNYQNGNVLQETLLVDGNEKLNRSKGTLWYEGTNSALEFEIDADILAVSKRDKKQHSFFEALYAWGKELYHYRFGTPLGRNHALQDLDAIKDNGEVDLKSGEKVIEVFIKGRDLFDGRFTAAIVADMKALSYNISDIQVGLLKNLPSPFYGLHVQEGDLDDPTYQTEMSQGMFRSLSLLVHLNYLLLNKTSSCILIDDIGEGLDYDRSKNLIDLIVDKVKNSDVQIIMTTNDRFVMNKVPLEYWSVIQRASKKSLFYNYENSREVFDEYTYTGLSNFDFLATEFYSSGFEKEES